MTQRRGILLSGFLELGSSADFHIMYLWVALLLIEWGPAMSAWWSYDHYKLLSYDWGSA